VSPTLSVVVPVYNEAPHLAQTIEGIVGALQQTDFDAELVLVDDGSTVLSAATMLSLAPAACALAGIVLLVLGGGVLFELGVGFVAAYGVVLAASTGLAALRFRSLRVGLLAAPALIATQAAYVAGFARGIATRR
jgi:hypothetical protein